MDLEIVHKLRRRIFFRKLSVRILLAEADSFHEADWYIDRVGVARSLASQVFSIFLLGEFVNCADDKDQRSSEFRLFGRFTYIIQ
jgi:hypothetical protein